MAYQYKYGAYMSTSGGSNFIRPYIYYQITVTDPNVNCHWWAGCDVKPNWRTDAKITLKTSASDASDRSATVDNKGWTGGTHAMIKDVDYNWPRGTSATTKTISVKMSTNVDSSSFTLSISVPALPTVTVSYNSLGGSSVSSTSLYYGVAGKVSSTRPTKTNYTFQGWSTTSGGTTAAYQPGSSITRTSNLTLYAIWKSAYTAPKISGEAKCYRVASDASGRNPAVLNDGTRAYIEFTTNKGVNVSNYNYSNSVTVKKGGSTVSGVSLSLTLDSSGSSTNVYYGYVTATNGLSKDYSYNISVTVTLRDVNSESHTITAGSFISAEVYEMDISTNGYRVAFGKLATDGATSFGVEVGGTLEVDGGSKLTGGVYDTYTSSYRSMNVISETASITRSSGATVTGTIKKWGALTNLYLSVTYSTQVAAGSNVFEGTLNSHKPIGYATGVGYYGARSIVAAISSSGSIVIRNASSSAVTLSDSVYIALTYIS